MSGGRMLAIAVLVASAAVSAAGAQARTLNTLHAFQGGSDGIDPVAPLIYQNGTLYGTTQLGGGANCTGIGCGVVFSLNPATRAEAAIYAFKGGIDGSTPGSLLYDGTQLYGGTNITVFSLDPTSGTGSETWSYKFKKPADANALLVPVGAFLYGTTLLQGTGNGGTVFKIKAAGGKAQTVYNFSETDGLTPDAGMIDVNGTLYGTTSGGGSTGIGTVYSFNPANGEETVLHSFGGASDGNNPNGLLLYQGGKLYGTTTGGGTIGAGIVFSVNLTTNVETVLYSFMGRIDAVNPPDGAAPTGSLAVIGGTLYGTTLAGGGTGCIAGEGCGTVFALNPTTGAETVLYQFTGGRDGSAPLGGLIAEGSKLYGTTSNGGKSSCRGTGSLPGCGTVFAIKP